MVKAGDPTLVRPGLSADVDGQSGDDEAYGPFLCERQNFSQMLAADEALVLKAGGPTLVRPGLSADVYSGKAVMMKLMGLSLRARGGVS